MFAPHPAYANIEFPEYEFNEYPKHVPVELKPGGIKGVHDFVLVNSEEEERVALGGEEIVREEDVKVVLQRQAKASGVLADKRWGPEKLRAALEAAGKTPEV